MERVSHFVLPKVGVESETRSFEARSTRLVERSRNMELCQRFLAEQSSEAVIELIMG
jgi:hypothetical protein